MLVFGLCEFESEQLSISDSHATEYSCETTSTFLANHFVKLRRILLLNICGVGDLFANFTAVLEFFLGRIELAKDNFEQSAWVLTDFFGAEDV